VALGAKIGALVGTRGIFELDRLLQGQIVKSCDLVDQLQRLTGLALNFLRSQIFIVEVNDLFNGTAAISQFFGNRDQRFDLGPTFRNTQATCVQVKW